MGAAYALLMLTNLIYNNFGADGAGVQFYFVSPVRFREIVLAKNLVHATILAFEMILIWIVVCFLYRPPSLYYTLTTIAGVLLAAFANMAVGNLLSHLHAEKIRFRHIRQTARREHHRLRQPGSASRRIRHRRGCLRARLFSPQALARDGAVCWRSRLSRLSATASSLTASTASPSTAAKPSSANFPVRSTIASRSAGLRFPLSPHPFLKLLQARV